MASPGQSVHDQVVEYLLNSSDSFSAVGGACHLGNYGTTDTMASSDKCLEFLSLVDRRKRPRTGCNQSLGLVIC